VSARQDPQVDVEILAAGIVQLPAYLRSSAVARPIVVTVAGQTYRPGISIGFLLDLMGDLKRRAPDLDPELAARIAPLAREFEVTRAMDAAAYADHLQRELKSQLDGLKYYLDDLTRAKGDPGADYPAEIRARTRIALLLAEADARGVDTASARARLAELDRTLEALVEPGPYCGPPEQAAHYPERDHPWLYRRPR
jgi:hypothetical protein